MSNTPHCHYPSFSSSLLEEIYRSFDDKEFNSRSRCHSDTSYARRTKMAKTSNNMNYTNCYTNTHTRVEKKAYDDIYRVNDFKYVVDQWMDKEKEKAKIRRNSMPDDAKFRRPIKLISSSSTSSSGSSSSTISDTDSLYGTTKLSKKVVPSLKPIRTGASTPESRREITATARKKVGKKEALQQRALKLYGDLKKVKQPISPGGKLATFLNSLFHTNNNNHVKKRNVDVNNKPSSNNTDHGVKIPTVVSTPSSSYFRSCLSKTPSSAGRFERRSVRFCPVTEVYNDDVCKMDVSTTTTTLASDEEFKAQIMEKHKRVEEVAKELLKNYHNNNNKNNNNSHYRKELKVNVVSDHHNMEGFEFEDEDDESCCSSDLFELDGILEIGVDDRYCQELPVYETTHVATNRAIANGFIL